MSLSISPQYGKNVQPKEGSEPKYHGVKMSIDWDAVRAQREERIRWEIEQGLNPIESHEVTADAKPEPKRPAKDFNGGTRWTQGTPRVYDHDEIIQLYVDGHSGIEIARRIGANKATVYGVLRAAKVTREGNGAAKRM